MRVNVYADEITPRFMIIEKKRDGEVFTGLRFYLELPMTTRLPQSDNDKGKHVAGPFIAKQKQYHDDSSAVTFWAKNDQDLRVLLGQAQAALDRHYERKLPGGA